MYKKKIEVLIVPYIAKCTKRSEMLPPLFCFFGFHKISEPGCSDFAPIQLPEH